MYIRNLISAVLIIAGLGGPLPARADFLAVATMEGTYEQPVNTSGWQPIRIIAEPAGTSVEFKTAKANDRVMITYSASCSALGFTAYVRANIDGVIASPGSTSKVDLCSMSSSGSASPTSRTFSAVVVTQGEHRITIEVLGSTDAAIFIGNSSLVVQN
jgi:hypothetical protein